MRDADGSLLVFSSLRLAASSAFRAAMILRKWLASRRLSGATESKPLSSFVVFIVIINHRLHSASWNFARSRSEASGPITNSRSSPSCRRQLGYGSTEHGHPCQAPHLVLASATSTIATDCVFIIRRRATAVASDVVMLLNG